MNIAALEKVLDMAKNVMNLSETVAKSADPEKYADSVEKIHRGVADTYSTLREVILKSEEFSDAEKVEKLMLIAELEHKAKDECGKSLEEDREHFAVTTVNFVDNIMGTMVKVVPNAVQSLNSSATGEVKKLLGNIVVDGEIIGTGK